ncbi:MAG: CBS domain-containing protein [Cellulosilyticum sp.]|nr:CBS domain-containing protein [Cellulosilyticum sp.]
MIIKNILIPYQDLTKVSIHDTAGKTLEMIDSEQLLSLPVVDGNQFIGIISKRYILEEFYNSNEEKETFLKRPVVEFMKTKVPCLSSDDLVEEALKLLCEHNVQFIPIVNEKNEFAGIVSHKAVFRTFRNALGIGHTRLVITTYDLKGRLAKLSEIIAKENGNIMSIVQVDPEVMGLKELILRVEITNAQKLVKVLNENGFTVRKVN